MFYYINVNRHNENTFIQIANRAPDMNKDTMLRMLADFLQKKFVAPQIDVTKIVLKQKHIIKLLHVHTHTHTHTHT